MAVVIRLQRIGKPKQAYFRIVAIDKTRGAAGKPLEVIGSYNPRVVSSKEKIQIKGDRFEHWVKHGAKPSDTVFSLAKKSGQVPQEALKG